jgi:hypothetical protein
MPKVISIEDLNDSDYIKTIEAESLDNLVKDLCNLHRVSIIKDMTFPLDRRVGVYATAYQIITRSGGIMPAVNAGQGNISVDASSRVVRIDMQELLPVATAIATQLEKKENKEWYVLKDYKEPDLTQNKSPEPKRE